MLRRSGVPEKYGAATWDRCAAAEVLKPWTARIRENVSVGRGFVITGPVGTGKSSAAGLICREAIMAGLSVRWETVQTMLDEMDDRATKRPAFLRQRDVDLLVWDDFNVGALANWHVPLLDRVVEHRYSRHKAMIVTSNVQVAMLAGDDRIQRFVDRWRERLQPLEIGGESLRKRQQ